MENHEGDKNVDANAKVEQPAAKVETSEQLLDRIKTLESTNDRLLTQSKDNADKYRSIRDKADAKEKEELLSQENFKGLLGKKEEDYSTLETNYQNLKN